MQQSFDPSLMQLVGKEVQAMAANIYRCSLDRNDLLVQGL
ncbi:hypothetical protein BTN49_2785 [Candidatus Enterovibrio escicola]|uniref:Uncharacterized protein n=1 Tax=Candidatus Enterovibrio escicola TaxID=1927127 RepID=A0A2A5T0D6_9GAMM|nr:hypothetical protein BTN49_2785 [Candidatus Enterovibrio escacola]